jgi:hypothetical protein
MALSTWCGRLVASDARTLGNKQFGSGAIAFCLARTIVSGGPAELVGYSQSGNLSRRLFLIFQQGKMIGSRPSLYMKSGERR